MIHYLLDRIYHHVDKKKFKFKLKTILLLYNTQSIEITSELRPLNMFELFSFRFPFDELIAKLKLPKLPVPCEVGLEQKKEQD